MKDGTEGMGIAGRVFREAAPDPGGQAVKAALLRATPVPRGVPGNAGATVRRQANAYPGQRLFDLALALIALPFIVPALALAALWLWLREGGPVLYLSERMRDPTTRFHCIKLRTMRVADGVHSAGVLGGHRLTQVTRTGHFLRRSRFDEFPQLWNILAGEMGFVGPRPPLPRHVRSHLALFAGTLSVRPGVTGLATVLVHRREERTLARANSDDEAEALYAARCLPQKARLDRFYARRAGPLLDLYVIWLTLARQLPLPGGRRVRRMRGRPERRNAPAAAIR